MATAAKSIGVGPTGVEAGQIPLPGAAEMFAAMVSVANEGEAAASGAPVEVAPEEIGENPETEIDASVLLPMLDQQRAANPAATLVKPPVDTPSPVTVKVAPAALAPAAGAETPVTTRPVEPGPVTKLADGKTKLIDTAGRGGIRPTLIDGKGDATVAVGPDRVVTDPSPVMRPLGSGKAAPAATTDPAPVMRPVENGKPSRAIVTEPAPVMRPVQDSKPASVAVADKSPAMNPLAGSKPAPVAATDPAPVMRPIAASKPAPGTATDPVPVMRPVDAATPIGKGAQPATQNGKGDGPVAIDAAPALQVNVAPAATAPAQAQTDLAPKATPPLPAAAAQPQAKAADVKRASPQVQVAAADAQAAPVAAKARASRISAPPVSIETTQEATGTTPVSATATEIRAAVQPLHAAPALVQPLAAPVGAPVQNVATALSQQVLDMSGGDAWIDQIARDISQTAGKDGTMRFRLAPETLGELKVEITHSERGAHVRLNVTSESAQQALAAAEHKLTAEARAQGVRIAETEINFTGGQSQSRDASAFAREQGHQQAQASHQPRPPRGTSATPFTSSAAAPEGRGRTDRYA